MNHIKEEKSKFRERYLALLKSMGAQERKAKSDLIQDHILNHPLFKKSHVIMLYASIQYEVLTEKIMKEAVVKGKQVILPRVNQKTHELIPHKIAHLERDLSRGVYGILEPRESCQVCEVSSIQWILVPGLVFDRAGHRLGRGLGYYDRFLSPISGRIPTAGLAFDTQIASTLPSEDHDVVLDEVITNLSS